MPAPITATELISRRVVSFVIPGTFATARSAKNACRNPLDCGDALHSRKKSRSASQPSSKSTCVDNSTQRMIFSGENSPRVFAAIFFRVFSNKAGSGDSTLMSRILRGPAATNSSAYASAAACKSSLLAILSMTPASSALSAGTWFPESIMSSAFSAPIRRGSRCVPVAPGNSPSLTSGRPTAASALAIR